MSTGLVEHAAAMSSSSSSSKRDQPINLNAEEEPALRSLDRDNTATATARPSPPPTFEPSAPCSPPVPGRSSSRTGGGVVFEPETTRVCTSWRMHPGEQAVDVARAHVPQNHKTSTSVKELRTAVVPSDVYPAAQAAGEEHRVPAESSRASGRIVLGPSGGRSTQEVEAAGYMHQAVSLPRRGSKQVSHKPATAVTQVEGRDEGPASSATGGTVGNVALGVADGAMNSTRVSPGLEPTDVSEIGQKSQQQSWAEVDLTIEVHVPLNQYFLGFKIMGGKDQKVKGRKRKAKDDPLALLMPGNSKKVRSIKKTYGAEKPPLSVVQSMKTRSPPHKPSFSASRDASKVQTRLLVGRQSARVRGEDLTDMFSDKPVPSRKTPVQTMRNPQETFPATAMAKEGERANAKDRVQLWLALSRAMMAASSST
ncbi:hypothetical protein LXA43DRAFT_991875 [Ganoderma leucocontextum]|nr:hypothetical protein LXA43DRAFT_991875 [Ganoderma leucocontextum]